MISAWSSLIRERRPERKPRLGESAFSFPELLRQVLVRLEEQGTSKRPTLTRVRLEIAASELLQDLDFHALRITDICRRADCGHGTFYRYWTDREAVAREILSDFMEAIRLRRPTLPASTRLFDRLLAGHRYYIEMFRRNTGLMRCLFQLTMKQPAFAEIGTQANLRLAHRVVNAFEREAPAERGGERQRLAMALNCIAMVDGVLRNCFLHNTDVGLTDDELATQLSLIWYRAFLARDP
jgi:AcrR family transcriptional regulator